MQNNFRYCPKSLILLNQNSTKTIRITNRNSVIPKAFLDKKVAVYNGKVFKKILITRNKVGYRFGEFVLTRKSTKEKTKKLKKKKNKK
jgi:ribosomal protein S19